MKRFVCGDIHGAAKALKQCIDRSGFDKEKDQLYVLGDYADGWSEVPEVVEILMEIKNLIPLFGNHDHWFKIFYLEMPENIRSDYEKLYKSLKVINGKGVPAHVWLKQGGNATWDAYRDRVTDQDLIKHNKFFSNLHYYYEDNINGEEILFVHGGFNWEFPIEFAYNQKPTDLFWDRKMWHKAVELQILIDNGYPVREDKQRFGDYDHIYIGHTSLIHEYEGMEQHVVPNTACNITNMDTGAGSAGKLTFMDLDSKEIFQSDLVRELYPDEKGRK